MIHPVLILTIPLSLTALGGLFSEKSGHLNIALEGLIILGAFSAITAASLTGQIYAGILAGVILPMAIAALQGTITVQLRTNNFIVGLGFNLLLIGICSLFSSLLFHTKGVVSLSAHIPGIPDIRRFQSVLDIFFLGITVSAYAASVYILNHSAMGLRIRAAGESAGILQLRGINPLPYQLWGFILSGAGCGAAGAYMALRLQAYVPNISAGKGWIGLVIVFIGRKNPWGIAIACIAFAFLNHITSILQGHIAIPGTVVLSFPYFITILILTLYSGFGKRRKNR